MGILAGTKIWFSHYKVWANEVGHQISLPLVVISRWMSMNARFLLHGRHDTELCMSSIQCKATFVCIGDLWLFWHYPLRATHYVHMLISSTRVCFAQNQCGHVTWHRPLNPSFSPSAKAFTMFYLQHGN